MGGAHLGTMEGHCCSNSDREGSGNEDIIPGYKSLASPFSKHNGPSKAHLICSSQGKPPTSLSVSSDAIGKADQKEIQELQK